MTDWWLQEKHSDDLFWGQIPQSIFFRFVKASPTLGFKDFIICSLGFIGAAAAGSVVGSCPWCVSGPQCS